MYDNNGDSMCALSEDTLAWEVMTEYRITPEQESLSEISRRIASEKNVPIDAVQAILVNAYGTSRWKDSVH